MHKVLLITNENEQCQAQLSKILTKLGYKTLCTSDTEKAQQVVAERNIYAVFIDLDTIDEAREPRQQHQTILQNRATRPGIQKRHDMPRIRNGRGRLPAQAIQRRHIRSKDKMYIRAIREHPAHTHKKNRRRDIRNIPPANQRHAQNRKEQTQPPL